MNQSNESRPGKEHQHGITLYPEDGLRNKFSEYDHYDHRQYDLKQQTEWQDQRTDYVGFVEQQIPVGRNEQNENDKKNIKSNDGSADET